MRVSFAPVRSLPGSGGIDVKQNCCDAAQQVGNANRWTGQTAAFSVVLKSLNFNGKLAVGIAVPNNVTAPEPTVISASVEAVGKCAAVDIGKQLQAQTAQ
jgi:hypothetical protein